MNIEPVLTVIPARGGSKGLPGKNIRPLAGLPLLVHSILCADLCNDITRFIVSSDDDDIIKIAKSYGAEVPFVRPAELAADETPMIHVLQHALKTMEQLDKIRYEALILLDPTSPGRNPEDITNALSLLSNTPDADGIVGVSIPEFNPIWHCLHEKNGYMEPLFAEAKNFTRRQNLPIVYRINATLYIWRRDFLLSIDTNWMTGKNMIYEIPEHRAVHIDDIHEFNKTEAMLEKGLLKFPWLS